jgi:prolipoprotein diacylglyceryl transferase
MFPTLHLGPLSIQAFGFILLLGLWLGLLLSEKLAPRISPNFAISQLGNLVIVSLLAGLIGARLTYVARSPQAFATAPWQALIPSSSALDLEGGLLFATLALLIYRQRKQLPFWQMLDALTPLFCTLLIALPIANLAQGNAYGRPTTLPWGIYLWNAYRHPTQIYEALIALLITAWLWPRRTPLPPGVRFAQFLTLSAAAQLFLQTWRSTPSNNLLIQLIAWLFMAIGLLIWGLLRNQHASEGDIS